MKYTYIFFVLLLLLNNSCTKNDPTGPEVIAGEPIAVATIGPDGGTLETEDFKLTIPPGAFNDSQELQLLIESDNSILGDNAASNLYRIEGITEGFQVPVEIKIRYNTTLSGENFIMIGDSTTISTIDTTYNDIAYFPLDANESGGFLMGELPSQNQDSNNKYKSSTYMVDDERHFYLGLITGGENYNHRHFIFKRTKGQINDTQASLLLNGFETSFDRFYTLLFPDMDLLHNTIPVHIEQSDIGGLKFGVSMHTDFRPVESYPPYISVTWYEGLDIPNHIFYEVNPAVGQYIHKVLFEIDGINTFRDAVIEWSQWYGYEYNYWKEYADIDLIEKAISRAFIELFVWQQWDATANGLMIEYLVGRYGDNIIRDILREISVNTLEGYYLDAMISKTDHPKDWLADFYEYLILNSSIRDRITYVDNLIDFWKGLAEKEILINSSTTHYEEPSSYRELSAKLYDIKLADNLQAGNILEFSTEGGDAELSVFKYNNSNIEFIKSGVGTLDIEKIDELSAQGYDLFVLVTNRDINFNAKKHSGVNTMNDEITLTIELKEHELKITGCTILLQAMRGVLVNGNGGIFLNDWHFALQYDRGLGSSTVTFENNTLTQHYDNDPNNPGTNTGDIMIVFSSEPGQGSKIVSIDATQVSTTATQTWTSSLLANNIPFNDNYSDSADLNYNLVGDEVCNSITSINIMKYQHNYVPLYLLKDSHYCLSGSPLNIYIHRE